VTRGILGQAQVRLRLGQHLEDAQEVLFRERGRDGLEPLALLGDELRDEHALPRRDLEEQELAEVEDQLAREVPVVRAVVGEALDQLQGGQAVARGHGARSGQQQLAVDEAEAARRRLRRARSGR
jgi:hypothetical protein